MTNIATVVANVSGNSFVGLDTEVKVALKGGKANPMQGRVTKRTIGSSVMVFQNKNINGYAAMVERRLKSEGKNPKSFELGPRKWGERIPNTPLIKHTNKAGETKHYLEVIFLKSGSSTYYLDGKVIEKDQIEGLDDTDRTPTGQGGLEDQVIIRTYDVASLTKVRIDKTEYVGPFKYV